MPLAGAAGLFGTGNFTAGSPDQGHASGENLFYVAKIASTAAGTDQVFLKVYRNGVDNIHFSPTQLANEGTLVNNWSVVSTGGASNLVLDQLRVAHSGTGFPQIDEIRMGTTWQDVTGLAPQTLQATNGDFEASGQGSTGDGLQDIVGWFDSTPTFSSWEFGRPGGSGNPVDVAGTLREDGWMYQSLGVYSSDDGTLLEWTADAVNTNIGNGAGDPFEIDFFAGAFGSAAEGTDIVGQGLLHLGGASFSDSGNNVVDVVTRMGSIDLAGLTDGTEVWVRFQGGNFDGIDNFSIQQISLPVVVPEPATIIIAARGFC